MRKHCIPQPISRLESIKKIRNEKPIRLLPKKYFVALSSLLLIFLFSCSTPKSFVISPWKPYDESAEIAANREHENSRMQYKLIQSKFLDKNEIWNAVGPQIADFSEKKYQELKPLILEQDIPTLQAHIRSGKLTYESIVQWYLWRIVKYENDRQKTLHTIIAINPNARAEARAKDRIKIARNHPIFGLPVLLKDNIGTEGLPTTAGAVALQDNRTKDAFITKNLKQNGAIILGKVNLSEWAYYFCGGCPVGYSAIGGQTLNPYGRRVFETGGSSSGSGTSMAANYAVAAVGTETSGSILSPSSANSIVGMKPTIGLLSRSGIVPISSTLDTPGPMTRNVIDNAIVFSAMLGKDENDPASIESEKRFMDILNGVSLNSPRLGVIKSYMERDSIYRTNVAAYQEFGAEIVELDMENLQLNGFLNLLNIDMKNDLPAYLSTYTADNIEIKNVADVVDFNRQNTTLLAPYGQARLEGILSDATTDQQLDSIKFILKYKAKAYFDREFIEHDLNAILSINNYHAGAAAVAQFPALTVPMGYRDSGQPVGLTFIGQPLTEDLLLKIAYTFEQATQRRKLPDGYE